MPHLDDSRARWAAWLLSYGAENFYDAFVRSAQGAESVCVHCGQEIYLDIVEGGGCPDWGARMDGFEGLDYGCDDAPGASEDGAGSHEPRKLED